ncbi:DUF308 domain-containing protein [Streptomyces sp. R-07]|uniref:DUF308 domain-containing protein n=1 Tax=Streptomyces sp. R-07 TaxID=3404052 RepID=UPI003CEB9858
MARALDLPETAVALGRYGRRAVRVMAAAGVLFALAGGVALVWPEETWTDDLTGAFSVIAVLTLGAGLGSRILAWRMRRALGSGAWSAHPAVSVRSMRTEAVVLRSPAGEELWPLEVIAMRQRYEPVRPGADGVMWWCGDPARGGVLAPPGGGVLIWARPVRQRRARQRIVGLTGGTGILGRATPAQPQGPVPVPVQVPTSKPNPVPTPVPTPVQRAEADASGAPTYARLADHAVRQAVPHTRSRRPEADVAEVPWWRVRSLRRTAGIGQVIGALVLCAAAGAAALVRPAGGSLMKLYLVAIVALAALAYSGYRMLTAGLPAVRMMTRAARSPVPVPRRYVLLHDPQGGHPVLVLFPAHGGDDDLPVGSLALLTPGTPKQPWLGLPAQPTGTVELRGWRDHSAGGLPVVVPRFKGLGLWPAEPYRPAGEADTAALLARLAPPMASQVSQSSQASQGSQGSQG